MRDILVTGCTGLLKRELFEKLGDEIRTIVADGEEVCADCPKGRIYRYGPENRSFAQLFDVYSFSTVIFVSGYVDGKNGLENEGKSLEQTLLQAAHAHVDKVIVLASIESQNYVSVMGSGGVELDREFYQAQSLRAGQTEEMCRFFARTTSLKLVTLRIPYLADSENDRNFLGSIFKQAYQGKKVILPYRESDCMDLISQSDLGDLLRRIVEEDDDESGSWEVSSGYKHTFGDLVSILKLSDSEIRAVYENRADVMPHEYYPYGLRKRYGWIPKDDVMENVLSLYNQFCRNLGQQGSGPLEWLKAFLEGGQGLLKYLEVMIVFILSELLHHMAGNDVYFRFVDVRLLFVVIMGTIYGIWIGILAGVLACIALLVQYLQSGMEWTVLFYNVENWIPFTTYLMAGSVTGYVKNKKTEEIKFTREEYELLRDKYIFLNEVYQSTMENKGEYKKQILGFKDSFGRIFDAVQKLDHILPQEIFLEALLIMEDILENHSIAIYSVDQYERFGRLVACSEQMRNKLPKSAVLSEIGELFRTVKNGAVYKNISMEDGMPAYANGIFRDGQLVLLVVIYYVNAEQYGMSYLNLFRILCGLVQTAFLRALDYTELTEEKIYYPGTNVMHTERFTEILSVQEEMKEKKVAEYVLVKLDETDKQRVSDTLSRMIRTADIIGIGADGQMYLLLTQVNQDSFHFVENRLAGTGLRYHVVEKVG